MSLYKDEEPENLIVSLESMIHQSLQPSEIVVVVDGKIGQDLENILEKYKSNLKLVRLAKNVGLGKALAIGLNEVTNEIVVRMDTDDISVVNRCEKQLSYLGKHPDIAVLGSNIIEFNGSTKNMTGKRVVPQTFSGIKKNIHFKNPMNHVSVVFRKSAVLASGNYQTFFYFEDYALWARMIRNGYKFANLPEILVEVRVGKEMINRRSGIKYFKRELQFQRYLLSMGINNRLEYLRNIIVRCGSRLMPKLVLGLLYKLQRS